MYLSVAAFMKCQQTLVIFDIFIFFLLFYALTLVLFYCIFYWPAYKKSPQLRGFYFNYVEGKLFTAKHI